MKAPKADPTAPPKFKPVPALNDAVALAKLADTLEFSRRMEARYMDNGLPEDEVQRARRLAEEALRDARGALNGLLIAQGGQRLDTAETKRWMDILASVILEIEPL